MAWKGPRSSGAAQAETNERTGRKMKPDFALSLTFEGITLLHRAAGGWRRVGSVSPNSADLREELAALRAKGLLLRPEGVTTKVILPNDQIRYMSVETGDAEGEALLDIVRPELEQATPYGLDELAFDISPDGATTHLAAVALDTLEEAESFAAEHGFGPVSFVAVPGEEPFLGEPFFGPAQDAATYLDGAEVEPDGIAVVVIGEAEIPEPPQVETPEPAPEPQPEAEPEPESPPDPTESADTNAPSGAFVSRRGKMAESAPPSPDGDDASEAEAAPRNDPPADTAEEAPEPTQAGNLSVTAPVLDVPDLPQDMWPDEHPDEAAPPAAFGAFLSRRKKTAKPAKPARSAKPAKAVTITLPDRQVPRDEAARMTVFGARNRGEAGGTPRRLGVILTAGLLVLFAAIAAWASLMLDDGVTGLFRADEAETTVASVPDIQPPALQDSRPETPAAPTGSVTALAQRPGADAATPAPVPSEQPSAPALTDTDAAVLDALRTPEETPADEPLPEELADEPEPEEGTDTALLEDGAPEPETDAETDAPLADTPETDVARYAATGIWPSAPEAPEVPPVVSLDDLFVASIDRTDLAQDAVALPPAQSYDTDQSPEILSSPVAPGTEFALDERGLVTPSAEGTLNPDGILVYQGPPPARPAAFPQRDEPEIEADTAARARLAGFRPRTRPGDLVERAERSQLGGLTRDELAGLRPRLRPESEQEQAQPTVAAPPTDQAVARSVRPDARPDGFDQVVARAVEEEQDEPEPEAPARTATVQPSLPSSASVARQATMDNAINLRQVNLIGVYGTPSNRRALVRLPSGRYKKVKVGDSVDGGRVVAIGDSELRYQKGGRNHTLSIPSG